ncbi:MAG: hypothetical protein WDN46_08290 [Methylocella sp.]
MATFPTAEEHARLILTILKAHDTGVDEARMMAAAVVSQFMKAGYDAEAYKAGIDFAVEQGWRGPWSN